MDRHPDVLEKMKEMAMAFSAELESGKKPMEEYGAKRDTNADE